MTRHSLARRLPAILLTLLLTAFLLGICLIVQGTFLEPRKLETTLLDINLPEWNKTEQPATIVALADLHAGPGDENRIRNIVEKTLALAPEIIVLLGDFAQGHTAESTMSPEQIAATLRPLARVPVYYILGNHDYACGAASFDRAFQAAGFIKMEGQSRIITFKNAKSIQLSGISDDDTYPAHAGSTPPKQHPETPQIVITHSPGAFPVIPSHVDLTLAGHTHGGQICLPGGYPLSPVPTRCTKELMSGYHRHGNKQIYISRGLGTSILPIRLFCPPEIVHIRLH